MYSTKVKAELYAYMHVHTHTYPIHIVMDRIYSLQKSLSTFLSYWKPRSL
jgi:hypothetical protein